MSIFGGVSKFKQIPILKNGVEILVATPGRLIDFIQREVISMDSVTFCVLDESDELIKKGYEPQIRAIVSQIRPDKQILMFSASWPESVQKISGDYFDEYTHIQIESRNRNIEQIVECCSRESDKMEKLIKFLLKIDLNENSKVLIFVDFIFKCDELAMDLIDYGFEKHVLSLNRKKTQNERDQVLKDFCDGNCLILVASNIAARGLDIPGLKYVINYDCPRDIETYIHRIGRTGRGNKFGTAYTLLTNIDKHISNDLIQILSETNQIIDFKLKEMAREFRRSEFDKKTKLHYFNDHSENYFRKITINKNTTKDLFVNYNHVQKYPRHESPYYQRYRPYDRYSPTLRLSLREHHRYFKDDGREGHHSRYD